MAGPFVPLFADLSGISLSGGMHCLNVREAPYNAVGNGLADDTGPIQAAINDASDATKPTIVYVPGGLYSVLPLNLTNRGRLKIIGDGWNATRFVPGAAPIYNTTSGHVFDLSGSLNVRLQGFQLGTFDYTVAAMTGIFCGQTPNNVSNAIILDDVYVTGRYLAAAFYSYGVPSSQIYSGKFYNYMPGGGSPNRSVGIFTENNAFALTSQFATLATGKRSAGDWAIHGSEFHQFPGAGGDGLGLWLEDVDGSPVNMFGGNITGGCAHYVGISGTSRFNPMGVTFETESEVAVPSSVYHRFAGSTLKLHQPYASCAYHPPSIAMTSGPGAGP